MSLTAGVITLVSSQQSQVQLSATAASGGSGPYTQQWYKSTTTGFSPAGGNLITGATALTLTDTAVVPGTTYYYKVVYTDTGNSNITVTATQLAVTTPLPTQNPNAFSQSVQVGMIDLMTEPNTVSVVIDSTESATLYPGMPVKLVDGTSKIPTVLACTADTDEVYGFINYNVKNRSFVAGDSCEISMAGNVMYLYASSAIARGAEVCVTVAARSSVGPSLSTSNVVGWAVDKATAQGQLIRVYLKTPSFKFAS
jgi:hypothetical protein